ncbi:hypothetical protein JM16_009541 [Phytophthora kernoviae]|uniref:Cytochrome P450 n=1 Tax=Phytophthora kernoviae TaxID=325452 RepID=A0A8T0LKX6_9STRA|nr:hypothetical protein JM16_009541 [Phytophthora kernoviae]
MKAFKGVEAKELPEGVDAPVSVSYISPGLPILGHTMDMVHNADRFLDWLLELCQSTDGKPFILRLLGRSDLLIDADLEHHEQILKTQFGNFIKGDQFYDMLKHTHILLDIFREAAVGLKPIELGELMHRFTLDSFAEIGFGSTFGSLKSGEEHSFGKALDNALHIAAARRMVPMWLWKAKYWLNMGSERQLREFIQVMDSLIMGIILKGIAKHPNDQAGKTEDDQRTHRGIVSIILDHMHADGQPALTPPYGQHRLEFSF